MFGMWNCYKKTIFAEVLRAFKNSVFRAPRTHGIVGQMTDKKTLADKRRGARSLPAEFKASLAAAFTALQAHPKASLVQWGIENPTLFYSLVERIAMHKSLDPSVVNTLHIITGVPASAAVTQQVDTAIDAEYTEVDTGDDLV